MRDHTSLFAWFGGSWAGTLATAVASNINTVLTVLCAIASIGSSAMAIAVAWHTLKIRRVELLAADQALCDACRNGKRPDHCPLPASERPIDCPFNNQKKEKP